MTWVGEDAEGDDFSRACTNAEVLAAAIATVADATMPKCLLIYQPGEEYMCLLDTGGCEPDALSPTQIATRPAADFVLISAGPAAATRAVLEETPPTTSIGWILQRDADCFPKDLRRSIYTACRNHFLQ